MSLKVSAAHHDDTITQLTMDTLIVQLLEELLKVAWEIHGPGDIVRFSNGTVRHADKLDFAIYKNADTTNPRKKIRRMLVDSLIEAFGTNKQKRALSSRRLNQVGSDTLQQAVAKAANTVISQKGVEALQQEVDETEAQGDLALHLPPCNTDAETPENVYLFDDLGQEEGCPRIIQSKLFKTFTVETFKNGRMEQNMLPLWQPLSTVALILVVMEIPSREGYWDDDKPEGELASGRGGGVALKQDIVMDNSFYWPKHSNTTALCWLDTVAHIARDLDPISAVSNHIVLHDLPVPAETDAMSVVFIDAVTTKLHPAVLFRRNTTSTVFKYAVRNQAGQLTALQHSNSSAAVTVHKSRLSIGVDVVFCDEALS
ncbi:hypothetical protein INR49_030885 [Caranx melampygus]|nr:hypothetical protein INR49_030885 [Caranx melampygus]